RLRDCEGIRVPAGRLAACLLQLLHLEIWPYSAASDCYSWVNYGLSNNLPFMHVVPARLDRDEPAVFDQNFGRVDRALPVPDGVGAVDTDIARADGRFGPVLEPIEQFLRRRRLLRFLDWLRFRICKQKRFLTRHRNFPSLLLASTVRFAC